MIAVFALFLLISIGMLVVNILSYRHVTKLLRKRTEKSSMIANVVATSGIRNIAEALTVKLLSIFNSNFVISSCHLRNRRETTLCERTIHITKVITINFEMVTLRNYTTACRKQLSWMKRPRIILQKR